MSCTLYIFHLFPQVSITIPLFPALYFGKLISIYIFNGLPCLLFPVVFGHWEALAWKQMVRRQNPDFFSPVVKGLAIAVNFYLSLQLLTGRHFYTATTPSKFSTCNLSIHQALFNYLFKCALSCCILSCTCYTLSYRVSLGNSGHYYVENELEASISHSREKWRLELRQAWWVELEKEGKRLHS